MKQITISVLLIASFFVSMVGYAQLSFVENKGQWDDKVNFKADIQAGAFFLQKDGFTVLLHQQDDLQKFSEEMHGHGDVTGKGTTPDFGKTMTIRSHAYRTHFIGASPDVKALPEKILPTYDNYYIGNDKSKWQSDCKIYQAVLYKNIYPNIDVRYYTDAETLKYDIIVNPGGNINNIRIGYEGVDNLKIKNEELLIGTSVGQVKELYPYTYQVTKAGREVLDCKYQLQKNVVKFNVKNYSPDATIVIDPTLIFSTFTGSTADNWGFTATPGPDGSLFAAGIVFGSGFPVSPGAYSTNFNGGVNDDGFGPYDIALIKFSPNGTQRLYATYLGGNGNEQPHSMICDAQGDLILAGRSNSNSSRGGYPTTIPSVGDTGKYDIVISKFNSTGTALLGSIKIGGKDDDGVNIRPKYGTLVGIAPPGKTDGAFETRRNYGDDARSEVLLDGNNNIILVSCTQSRTFPIIGSAFQPVFGGGLQDGLVLRFNPSLSAVQSTSFFGGTGTDACFVVSINPTNNNIYVAGGTTSSNLPGDRTSVITSTFQGGEADGFVAQLNATASAIIKTTYQGTPGNDLVYGIQFDKNGFPYIMGTTTGTWPIINSPYNHPGGKQFISKLQPDLSAYVYSTVFGTNSVDPNISPVAFLVDRCQNVYVSGWGGTPNTNKLYPSASTRGLPVTPNAIKSTTDGNDFYFFVLEKNAASQLFGSFFGQTNGEFGDHVDGGTSRFDANGVIYQAICANCSGPTTVGFFPTTPGAWARTNGSSVCNEAAIKIEMNFSGISSTVQVSIDGVKNDTAGCAPLTVTFTDTIAKAKKYIWDFGDASPNETTTSATVNHLYIASGYYKIMLIGIDSSKCNIADTAYATVKVGTNEIRPSFNPVKEPPCLNLTYDFINTSTSIFGGEKSGKYIWNFDDGSAVDTTTYDPPVKHTFAAPGTYKVKLTAIDTSFCNAPVSYEQTIRIATTVKAIVNTPEKGCAPYTAILDNQSAGGTSFEWDFGDGTTSTDISPTHVYTVPNIYHVVLIATDINSCNKTDTARFTITVYGKAKADFNFSPIPPRQNTPTQFANASLNAVKYMWDFGDGDSSITANPSHQFNATGTFTVCLMAINNAGCIDTICKPVEAIVFPLLDVPNAFTPATNDINSIIRVAGFGISKMTWNIYNRWGQLIFRSVTPKIGWDGTYKNKAQPMDVYTYTLDVEMFDGKKISRTGDITLIR